MLNVILSQFSTFSRAKMYWTSRMLVTNWVLPLSTHIYTCVVSCYLHRKYWSVIHISMLKKIFITAQCRISSYLLRLFNRGTNHIYRNEFLVANFIDMMHELTLLYDSVLSLQIKRTWTFTYVSVVSLQTLGREQL